MPSPETLATVSAASLLLAVTPGPDNLFVLTQAALGGVRRGLMVVLGLCTGLIGHTAFVAVGAAAIFETSALAFSILKYFGAAYLLYLAWGTFRSAATEFDGDSSGCGLGMDAMYRRGVIMSMTNPKVSLFFLAFLPQFADEARGSIGSQIVIFGLVFQVVTLLVFGGVAIAAGRLGEWLHQHPGVQRGMNCATSMFFVALAVRLIAAER
ncbi:MAG: LysE family translocator [Planctomycetes bacterium]|nr:LysE family translocator [Planctomycetota bacterium]